VKQTAERCHNVSDVAERLGGSVYTWIKRCNLPDDQRKMVDSQAAELRRLKAELKLVTKKNATS
jgi:transposase